MNSNKCLLSLFISILIFFKVGNTCAQAPNISYAGPQTYNVNTSIASLTPVNKGGAVPAIAYGQVSTLAGNRIHAYVDGTGANASFVGPNGITVDAAGNVYVSDNVLIRKITPSGMVTTLAGNLSGIYADGQGTAAGFTAPCGMAIDAAGNMFVADFNADYIRKITPGGLVTTFAGSGFAQAGNPQTADGTLLTAKFDGPFGLGFDSKGNLFVAEYRGEVIRKIDKTGQVTTFAGMPATSGSLDGTGSAARLWWPSYTTIDAADNIYFSDYDNNWIRKITAAGVVTTLAKGSVDGFRSSTGMASDASGNIYFADYGNHYIKKIDAAGVISIVTGNGTVGFADGLPAAASFDDPYGLVADGKGNLYIADGGNYLIRKISLYGYTIDKPLPPGLVFNATTGIISGTPTSASPSTDYTITAYNSSGSSSAVVNISVSGVNPVPGAPVISYQSPQTYSINTAITPLSPKNTGGAVPPNIYGQVITFAGTGKAGVVNGTGTAASISAPLGLTTDANGNIYVGDYNNNTIRQITPAAVVTTYAGIPGAHGSNDGSAKTATFALPQGVAADKAGNIYVADSYNNLIRKIQSNGVVSTIAGQAGIAGSANGMNATFNSPTGIAIDNSGNLYITDQGNNLIRKIATNGNVSTFAGSAGVTGSANGMNATFYAPADLVFDTSQNMYVADAGNNLIRMINPAGLVSTFAGSGAAAAQDGQGAAASFNHPIGISIDYNNIIYVADEKNNIIRRIDPTGMVATLAGNGSSGAVDGIEKNATFSYPGSIAADNLGNVYVGDISTFLIRKVTVTGYEINKPLPAGLTFDPKTGIISGTPTVLSPPTNYTVTAYNSAGSSSTIVNIAVKGAIVLPAAPDISYQTPQTYTVKNPIIPLIPANKGGAVPANTYGLVTTVAGTSSKGNTNGQGTAASFGGPDGLVFDQSGNLFVSEVLNNDIREISPTGLVSTFAGTGAMGNTNGAGNKASFNGPNQLSIDASGNIYVADENNQVIRKITPAGLVSSFAGSGSAGSNDGTTATASFNDPVGTVIDPLGNMYVADRGSSKIRKIDLAGQVTTFTTVDGGASPGTVDAGLAFLATDASGDVYFGNTNQVEESPPAVSVKTVAGNTTGGYANGNGAAAQFFRVAGVAVNAVGDIFIGDTFNNRIRRVNPAGVVNTLAGEGGKGFDDGVGSSATFYNPAGVVLDATQNFLYVADYSYDLIRRITITGYAIDKSLPNGLVFDPKTGIISGTPSIPTPPETYTITAYNTGGSSTTTVVIEILEATVTFAAMPQKTVCDADFDPGATGTGAITYTSNNPAVATIVSGKVHITGPGTADITASDGTSTVTQTLTVIAAVTPTIVVSPSAADDCQGNVVTFNTTITDGGANPSYQWQVNGQNTGGNTAQFTSSNLNSGDNVACILTSTAGCVTSATAISNTATFTVDPPVSTSVKITSSETGPICAGTSVTFTATAFSPDVNPAYQWQVDGVNAGTNQPTFTTANLAEGSIVTCVLTSTGKCLIDAVTTSNAITISLNPASQCVVMVPNTFTPNGDGINDIWNITALQSYPGCTISIYNRYGALIYNTINYPKPWDGTANGKKLTVGTYYYIIDLKNGKKPLSGSVTILR